MKRNALYLFLAFGACEALVSTIAQADPYGIPALMRLEGPLSLVFLVSALVVTWRAAGRPVRVTMVGTLSLLGFLATVPVAPPPESEFSLLVEKAERRLTLHYQGVAIDDFPIALGNPVGDKRLMGDGKTPLGRFRIVDKAPSDFHLWMGLSYPTTDDAWAGRRAGLITWAEYLYIRIENLNGRIPYSSSVLGGAVGIHGGGVENDWTLGCVALSNPDVEAIYQLVPVGTEVLILP